MEATRGVRATAALLRIGFAALLLAAAGGKLLDLHGFVAVVAAYDALPLQWLWSVSLAIAGFELLLGLLILGGRHLPTAGVLLIALHLLYLGWLALALYRGLELTNCGCFGVYWPRPLSAVRLLEDLVLLLLAVVFWRCQRYRQDAGKSGLRGQG